MSAILLDPSQDDARLAYADWLRREGDADQAEFINLQCRLARCRTFPDHVRGKLCVCEGCRMRERITCLLTPEAVADWVDAKGLMSDGLSVPVQLVTYQIAHVPGTLGLQWSRGFPAWAQAPAGVFFTVAEALFRRHPITRVTLVDADYYLLSESRSSGDRHFWLNVPGRKMWLGSRSSKDLPPDIDRGASCRWLEDEISKSCVVRGRKLAGLRV